MATLTLTTTPCMHCDATGNGLDARPCGACDGRGFLELPDEYFTDADEAYCHARIDSWRRYLEKNPPEPDAERPRGNMDIWTDVLGGIRAVRSGASFDFRNRLTGVAIDGDVYDFHCAQLIARMSAYAVATWSN